MSRAGKWSIEVRGDGYPVWCRILHDDQEICGIRHTELRDLKHAVKRAIKEATDALPESLKGEMD
jgi:pyrimidine deaminase RibD-like protein